MWLNAVLPFGFIIAILGLFCAGVVVRAYLGKNFTYIFALSVSLSIFFLGTLSSGDTLILAGTIEGEKGYAGLVGVCLMLFSFIFPFLACLLPEKLFTRRLRAPIWRVPDADLQFMLSIVEITDVMLETAFLSGKFKAETKSDSTPVTEVDRDIEKYIRSHIERKFPNDGILGEEGDDKPAKNGSTRRWIVDPIDGTKNFVRGVPICATLIALEDEVTLENGERIIKPIKSIVSAPLLKTRYWGVSDAKVQLAFKQFDQSKPVRIEVSGISDPQDGTISISSRGGWAQNGRADFIDGLTRRFARTRGFGDFFSYMLLAQGSVDCATEPDLELYDIAALLPIVEGAGGRLVDVDQNAWTTRAGIRSALATNGALTLT
ncbi:MAG: hypothetical protein LBQ41_01710 [Candidatus Ancillula sp.]|jgi:histidinol-phosphatase|nr:hypothetical protein [Candidatus Ancillula sp.]